jgi:uncharacterized membrane protein
MLSCLADDFVFTDAGSTVRVAKHDLLPVLAWDAGVHGHARFRTVAASATTATVVVTERNDFYRLLGIRDQSYRARVTVRDGVIHEEVIEEMIKQGPTVAEALVPAMTWARLHRPEGLDEIYHVGQPIYDGESARPAQSACAPTRPPQRGWGRSLQLRYRWRHLCCLRRPDGIASEPAGAAWLRCYPSRRPCTHLARSPPSSRQLPISDQGLSMATVGEHLSYGGLHIADDSVRPSVRPRIRLRSIDIVRGLVIVLMALDHSRDFFTKLRFDPEILSQTYPSLFITRWVTHLCAPAFFLLAGTGAFLYANRHGARAARRFLLTRGLWLIVLEFTLVGTAWSFKFPWGFFGVIWCLGASMVGLAAVSTWRPPWILALSAGTVAFHDLLDQVRPDAFGSWAFLWSILHVKGPIAIGGAHEFVLFPLVPLWAVMALGYAMGPIFLKPDHGRRILLAAGTAMIAAFAILRATNIYGNPPAGLGGVSQGDWHLQATLAKTAILFFDVEKYPPSLQFLLMTLGPIFLLLWAADRWVAPRLTKPLLVFGRVPLFFYVTHLYVIHIFAIIVAVLWRQPVGWLFKGAIFADQPATYGHDLPFVYAMWLIALAILYWPCRKVAAVKQATKYRWLSYA